MNTSRLEAFSDGVFAIAFLNAYACPAALAVYYAFDHLSRARPTMASPGGGSW